MTHFQSGKIEVIDHKLFINNCICPLSHEVRRAQCLPEGILVVFEPDSPMEGRNIVLLDHDGKELWRIQRLGDADIANPYPYSGFDIKSDITEAWHSTGMRCKLNMNDGSIEPLDFRPFG